MNLSMDRPHGVRLFKSFQAILDMCPDEQRKEWYLSPYTSTDAPVIIAGCGRSGTSLLRTMLNAHPSFFCGPETALMLPMVGEQETITRKLAWLLDISEHPIRDLWTVPSQAMFVDVLFTTICLSKSKLRWAEKTPKNVMVMEWINRHWPNAYFIHMIRDGRDVIASLREHPKWKIVKGKRVPTNVRQPLKPCVERWILETREGLKWRGFPRYIELYYEDLIKFPDIRLPTLFRQINAPYDPRVLDPANRACDPVKDPQGANADQPLNTASLGRWKKDLSDEELAFIYSTPALELLTELGYAI